jgi:hypothetical protein
MSCKFCLFFNFFVPKAYVFENFTWGIIHMDFVSFPFRTSKLKMTSATLNTSFHIFLGKFIDDQKCIIQRLK